MSSPNDYPDPEHELGIEDDPAATLPALLEKLRRTGPLSPGRLTGSQERADVARFLALLDQLLIPF